MRVKNGRSSGATRRNTRRADSRQSVPCARVIGRPLSPIVTWVANLAPQFDSSGHRFCRRLERFRGTGFDAKIAPKADTGRVAIGETCHGCSQRTGDRTWEGTASTVDPFGTTDPRGDGL